MTPDAFRPPAHLVGSRIPMIHDLVGADGRTARERNLERKHLIPMGTLVEVLEFESGGNDVAGARGFIVAHERDCDGTPLYSIGFSPDGRGAISRGWTDENLEAVRV